MTTTGQTAKEAKSPPWSKLKELIRLQKSDADRKTFFDDALQNPDYPVYTFEKFRNETHTSQRGTWNHNPMQGEYEKGSKIFRVPHNTYAQSFWDRYSFDHSKLPENENVSSVGKFQVATSLVWDAFLTNLSFRPPTKQRRIKYQEYSLVEFDEDGFPIAIVSNGNPKNMYQCNILAINKENRLFYDLEGRENSVADDELNNIGYEKFEERELLYKEVCRKREMLEIECPKINERFKEKWQERYSNHPVLFRFGVGAILLVFAIPVMLSYAFPVLNATAALFAILSYATFHRNKKTSLLSASWNNSATLEDKTHQEWRNYRRRIEKFLLFCIPPAHLKFGMISIVGELALMIAYKDPKTCFGSLDQFLAEKSALNIKYLYPLRDKEKKGSDAEVNAAEKEKESGAEVGQEKKISGALVEAQNPDNKAKKQKYLDLFITPVTRTLLGQPTAKAVNHIPTDIRKIIRLLIE